MDEVLNTLIKIGALIFSGFLCSFLVILGTNKRKVWSAFGKGPEK